MTTTTYTAFSHPAANFAIGRAAIMCTRLLDRHGFNPEITAVGYAAYDSTVWIDDLEDDGYLDEIEARICRQLAFTAMTRAGKWKPRCVRRDLASQAIWEAEIIACARRIRDLTRKQATLFEAAEPEATTPAPRRVDTSRNVELFRAWLDAGDGTLH